MKENILREGTSCVNESEIKHPWWYNLKYLLLGIWFGVIIVKAELVSWYRIQEMFRFESFHMYGVIGSAVVIGIISVFIIKKFNVKTIHGESIKIAPKEFRKGQIFGGFIFGLGWAMTGACPGPLFANLGYGYTVIIVPILMAILGTYIFGKFKDKLPQ